MFFGVFIAAWIFMLKGGVHLILFLYFWSLPRIVEVSFTVVVFTKMSIVCGFDKVMVFFSSVLYYKCKLSISTGPSSRPGMTSLILIPSFPFISTDISMKSPLTSASVLKTQLNGRKSIPKSNKSKITWLKCKQKVKSTLVNNRIWTTCWSTQS